jgi:GGDEF domain-containing protein
MSYLAQHDFLTKLPNRMLLYPDDGTDAETLLKNADTALLNAKAQGRSNHRFFQQLTPA